MSASFSAVLFFVQAALLCYQHLTAASQYDTQLTSSDESPLAYEPPWDTSRACFIDDLSSTTKPLRQLSISEDRKQWTTSTFSRLLPCRQRTSSLEDTIVPNSPRIPLDRYLYVDIVELVQTRSSPFALAGTMTTCLVGMPSTFFKLVDPAVFSCVKARAAIRMITRCPSGKERNGRAYEHSDEFVSPRTTRHCMHMRICHTAGVFILGECSRPFADIPQMIEHFSQISVPIRGAAHMRLGTPVLRCEILSSSLSSSSHQHRCHEEADDLL